MSLSDKEKLYTRTEIIQVLKGLMNAYWSRPWYSRIFFKPWHDALATAILVIGGDLLVQEMTNAKLFDDIEDHLS